MPDWFYRTVARPLLFRLPVRAARRCALGVVGSLARLPLGPAVIDFLGHMRSDPRLRRPLLGITFPSPVGLGLWLDDDAFALPALARFGVGFIEVGPVTAGPAPPAKMVERRPGQEAFWQDDPPAGLTLAVAADRLACARCLGMPLVGRLGYTPGAGPERSAEECGRVIDKLAPSVALFTLPTLRAALAEGWGEGPWAAHVGRVVAAARGASPPRPVLLALPADLALEQAAPLIEAALAAGVSGLQVDGTVKAEPARRLVGLPAREPARELVRRLRERWGNELPILANGGVHEPADALELLAAGADLLQVDSGLAYTGPGLPKRANDAVLFAMTRGVPPAEPLRPAEASWLWAALLGAGMLVGGLLALVIAATRVVLPYDEAFVGLTRDELPSINPRLLLFMAHDRVSLAGAMVAVGVLYLGLALGGIRRGLHWARQTVLASAFTGFATFFLFLGFGYLDPFHAFVTAALLQLLLLATHCRLDTYRPAVPPDLRGDRRWRRGLWGQLLLVVHGFALLAAGLTISAIGATYVFVHEDLNFMRTTAEALRAAHPRLVPLVAHDRATLGGMLLANGWAFLLPALWGFRGGSAWLWWTLLAAGLPAYAAALGVHFAVGYIDWGHLAPAFTGLGLFLLGLGLACPYLCGKPDGETEQWARYAKALSRPPAGAPPATPPTGR
jgi:hypothetical protein